MTSDEYCSEIFNETESKMGQTALYNKAVATEDEARFLEKLNSHVNELFEDLGSMTR